MPPFPLRSLSKKSPPNFLPRRRLLVAAVFFAAGGIPALAWLADRPLFVANLKTDSLPAGIYFHAPFTRLDAGEIVFFRATGKTQRHIRRFFAAHKNPLLKKIAAIHSGTICWSPSSAVLTNGGQRQVFPISRPRFVRDDLANSCVSLRRGQMFVVGTHSDSFDSRYFGIVPVRDSRGVYKSFPGET